MSLSFHSNFLRFRQIPLLSIVASFTGNISAGRGKIEIIFSFQGKTIWFKTQKQMKCRKNSSIQFNFGIELLLICDFLDFSWNRRHCAWISVKLVTLGFLVDSTLRDTIVLPRTWIILSKCLVGKEILLQPARKPLKRYSRKLVNNFWQIFTALSWFKISFIHRAETKNTCNFRQHS